MLGSDAIERQKNILNKLNTIEKGYEVLCDDEITDDLLDLVHSEFVEELDDFETYGILTLFNPRAFRITEKGKEVLICQQFIGFS